MFSCKFYGILKNMFSIEQLWGTVSRNRKMDTRFIKDKFHWNLIHLYLVIWRLVLLLTGSLEKRIENHDLSKYEEQVKMQIYDTLHDCVPFAQFKKREKHLWKCYFYPAIKSNTLTWVFFTFLKLHKWQQIAQSISYIWFVRWFLIDMQNESKMYIFIRLDKLEIVCV